MDNKKCTVCHQPKPLTDFYKKGKSKYLASACKECTKIDLKKYREKYPIKIKDANRISYFKKREERIKTQKVWADNNPDKVKEAKRRHKQRNPNYSRLLTLKRHNISYQHFEKMITDSKNKCEICGSEFKSIPSIHLDHCHKSGKVRGLLCSFCNTALGLIKDDVLVLNKMINYLNNKNG